jgi:hypothetical protein
MNAKMSISPKNIKESLENNLDLKKPKLLKKSK